MTDVNQTIQLPDDRRLGYADFGDPNGHPILYFAGGLGSRLQIQPSPLHPLPAGVRLIGTDRPGLGLSDFQPGRQILDWPEDVLQLAQALGLAQFAVLGVSAGGPYALACAYKIPERLTACGLVASALPPEMMGSLRWLFWGYRRLAWLLRALYWWTAARHVGKSQAHFEKLLSKPFTISSRWPAADREMWSKPAFRRQALADKLEAFRQGTRGPVYEGGLWGRPWGFRLEDITFNRIYLWHGELDLNSPVAAARVMAATLPQYKAKYYEDAGHSVGSYHWQEILDEMTL